MTSEEARKKVIAEGYSIIDGRLINKTFCYTVTKGEELVSGCVCVDPGTGEFCGQPSVLVLAKKWDKAPKA